MTVYATRSPYWIQVGGSWIQLEGVAPEVPVSVSRPTTQIVTLGNTIFTQQAARLTRAWALSYAWADAEAGRWLDYAATNPGDVFFLDQTAAVVNMLDPRSTKGSSATLVSVEGVQMPTFTTTQGFTRKLRAGVQYYLSYTTTRSSGNSVGTYNIGAGAVTFNAPAGSGARRGSVNFTPASDVTLTVAWVTANVTTAARLTEGLVDSVGFIEGRNTPCQVAVQDASLTVNRVFSGRLPLSEVSYAITEIG